MAGCTNHGCIIEPKRGVGTNGPCRCLDELGKESARALRSRIWLMMELLRSVKDSPFGIYCEAVNGKNWFDERERLTGK